jgi:hypothetical protein
MNALFSEEDYLAANPDVAEAVMLGKFKNGEEHFDLHGRREGRRGGFGPVANDRPIFFCHIPKTAGTSVRMALEQAFAPHTVLPDAFMIARGGGRYPPLPIFEQSLSVQPNPVRLLRGHYPFAVHKLLREPLTIAILRDPVQRSISELRHLISIGVLDYAALVRSLDDGVLPAMSNGQVRFLSARFDEELPWEDPFHAYAGGAPEKADLEVARRTLETIGLLGVVEDMPGFSSRLKQTTGVELSEERANVGTAQINLDTGHMEVIRQHNLLDAVLYERALELLGTATTPCCG